MKKIILLFAIGFLGLPQICAAFGAANGYWIRTGPNNGAPVFLSINGDRMQIDRRRPVKISAVQSGDEYIVRQLNTKNRAQGLRDNNFDAMNVIDADTMLVTRPSSVGGVPARQTIYRRIGYEEARKYLPRKAKRRARR